MAETIMVHSGQGIMAQRNGAESHRFLSAFQMVGFLARLMCGGVLVWAGLPKIVSPHLFLEEIYAYELVGPLTGLSIAIVLPWMELVVGVAVILGAFGRSALLLLEMLMIVFIAAQASVLYRGMEVGCACFGQAYSHRISAATLSFDCAVFVAGLVAIGSSFRTRQLS